MLTPRGFPANISVPTVTGLGLGVTSPRIFILNSYELADDVAFNTGAHSAKFGIIIRNYRTFQNQDSRAGGQWRFRSLNNFLKGTVRDFDSPIVGADGVRNFRQTIFGFYGQDSFNVLPRLNINLGLRWEFVTTPVEANGKSGAVRFVMDPEGTKGPLFDNPSLRNLAPRVGFAWDPFGNGTTSLRGGFGMFHDQLLTSYWRTPSVRQPPFFIRGKLDNPSFDNTWNEFISEQADKTLRNDLTSMQYDLQTPYLLQYNLNVQRQLSPTMVASIGYAGSRGVHFQRAAEANTAIPEIINGKKFFDAGLKARNPRWADDRRSTFDAMSFYNALLLSFRKRFSSGMQFQGSYTWAKVVDEGSAVFAAALAGEFTSIDPEDHKSKRRLAFLDVRHNLVFNSMWEVPWGQNMTGAAGALVRGWQLGSIVTMQTCSPNTPVLAVNRSRNLARRNLFEVPNLKPGASNNPVFDNWTVDKYYDASAFEMQPVGYYGNLGRNTLIGPGVATFDFSLFKSTYVPAISEQFRVEFRAEFFNLFNRANFDNPSTDPVLLDDGTVNPAIGRIRGTTTDPRQIQFGMKLVW